MKKYRKLVLITILFLTIGFSAINTVLDINGIISFGYNEEDFNVYFYNVKKDNQNVNEVISEDKKSITVSTSDLLIVGDKAIYNYTIANTSKNYDANVKIECESPTSESISLTNVFLNTTITAGTKEEGTLTLEYLSETTEITEYTCTLSIEAIERTSIGEEFIFCDYDIGTEWTYDYTGAEQEFTVPCDGTYKVELWGASGGTHSYSGLGGYTSGDIFLNENEKLYIYVGEGANVNTSTYNGGGSCGSSCYSGGGASDVRLVNGMWNDNDGLKSRIMVAAGGGGPNLYATGSTGGFGGGLVGRNGYGRGLNNGSTGGTQTSGGISVTGSSTGKNGTFGIGGAAGDYGGGGGGSNSPTIGGSESGGGGGSSFISGHIGSIAIKSNSEPMGCLDSTTANYCSKHYSNYIFSNTKIIDGSGYNWTTQKDEYTGMPTHDGTSTMTGNSGNGYAKITFISSNKEVDNNFELLEGSTWETPAFEREEVFIVPNDGIYKIELWGASGGTHSYSGLGGYTSGEISLEKGNELYLHIGTSRNDGIATYNGGGSCSSSCYSGGGATDVRLKSGTWADFESLKSRIMVAAGGGGPNLYYTGSTGGFGGGLVGREGYGRGLNNGSTGGTQTGGGISVIGGSTGKDGKIGIGGAAGTYGGGGGGGYYGGGGGSNAPTIGGGESGGGGGSSFISGHNGCNAISSTSTESNIIHINESTHYLGLSFTNTKIIDGSGYNWTTEKGEYAGMPTHDGTSTMTGNIGNGYAKITLVSID